MPVPIDRKRIATAEVREGMDWNKLVADHQKIVNALKNAARMGKCMSVASIVQQAGLTDQEVRSHLGLMVIDRSGQYMSTDETVFCCLPGLISAVDKLEKGNGLR